MGTTIGPYQVLGELGRGGMGAVYRAQEASVNRIVALKVLSPHLQEDPSAITRFRREAEIVARLDHPGIVKIWNASLTEPPFYIAMEFLGGGSLRRRLTHGVLPLDEAVAITHQLCGALDHVHSRNVVHRDVKSGNILLDGHGRAVLTDFGIMRAGEHTHLTMTGAAFGTPDYMSPEQAKGLPLDHRSDLYSLGVVCYEMLTGSVPFRGEPLSVMRAIVDDPVPPPSHRIRGLPAGCDRFFAKALAKSPDQRFQSGSEMQAALHVLRGQRQGEKPAAAATAAVPAVETPPPPTRVAPAGTAPVARSGQGAGPVRTTRPVPDTRTRRAWLDGSRRSLLAALLLLAILAGGAGLTWSLARDHLATGGGGQLPAPAGPGIGVTAPRASQDAPGAATAPVPPAQKGDAQIPPADTVIVPDVLGLDVQTAIARLDARGLRSDRKPDDYSDSYARGQVMGQNPAGLSEVSPDTTVWLRKSIGPPTRAIGGAGGSGGGRRRPSGSSTPGGTNGSTGGAKPPSSGSSGGGGGGTPGSSGSSSGSGGGDMGAPPTGKPST